MSKLCLIALLCCGLVAVGQANPTGRIVGGADAVDGQFPHQISLRRSGSHTCGGSIISRNYILTAAHCVTAQDENGNLITYPANLFTIRAGTTDRLRGGVLAQVVDIRVNENYAGVLNDVALLKLAEPLIFSKNIQPIALASSETPAGEPVGISGWGRLKTGGDIPQKLQWNTLEAISRRQCLTSIGQSSETLICLKHPSSNGACNGDSGGPATYNGELVGVAGFVFGACGTRFPDGYAKVFYHVEWIKNHTDL